MVSLSAELGCGSDFVLLADLCYKFDQTAKGRPAALDDCEAQGAQLASVVTDAQYTALLAHMNANCELVTAVLYFLSISSASLFTFFKATFQYIY